MAKGKYTFIRVYTTTKKAFDDRANKLNDELKIMGVHNRKVPQIKLIDVLLAKKLNYISDKELIKMSCRRKRC